MEFRGRVSKVSKDVWRYLHYRTGQRSYYALCQLLGSGYRNVYNINGHFLGISMYEYFTSQAESRELIVMTYNFY